jgi:hypothetical protein
VGAGDGVGECHVGDSVYGLFIVEGSVFAEDATVAVGCVLAQADVGCDVELGEARAEETDSLDDWAGWVVGGGS